MGDIELFLTYLCDKIQPKLIFKVKEPQKPWPDALVETFLVFLVFNPCILNCFLQEKEPQKPWPKGKIWSFKDSPKVFGSPMLDVLLSKAPSLDDGLMHWLKHRPPIFQAMWDR